MIINSVKFENWQGYFGTHEFSFNGTGDRNSGFVIGDNTFGKTAFWEGIMFALYDHVPRRKNPKKFKPYIAENSNQHPLMNIDLFNTKNAYFSVTLVFTHEGENYTLQRRYSSKYENRAVKTETDLKKDSYLSNNSISGPGQFIEDDKKWILENILPERLAKFFLFDGERLEEYEELMEKEEDVQLRQDIEDIIRTPILKNGAEQFTRIKHKYKSDIAEEKMKHEQNKKNRVAVEKLEKEIKRLKKARDDNENEIKEYDKEIKQIDDWLLDNDTVKEAALRLIQAKENLATNKNIIKELRDDITREVEGSWKIIISKQVNSSISKLEEMRDKQNETIQEIGVLKENRKELQLRASGDPCKTCHRERSTPNDKELSSIKEEIRDLDLKLKRKEEASKFPTHEEYYRQKDELSKLRSSKDDLKLLIKKENDLMSALKEKRKLEDTRNKANSDITEEKEAEVKAQTTRKEGLGKKKNAALISKGSIKTKIDEAMKELSKYINIEKVDDKDTVKVRRIAKSIELTELLSEVFSNTLDDYRETMRKEVEDRASKTFMSISNNAENYSGLKISKNYTVSISNKKNLLDAGSQAQSLVMAYSIIDALSSCSGFEFPMIIDTPGRGLARKNMDAVFDYFANSNKQIIFLPNDLELDPEVAIEKYKNNVASIYQLEKIDKDRTEFKLLVNNLVK